MDELIPLALAPLPALSATRKMLRQIMPSPYPPWLSVPIGRETEFKQLACRLLAIFEAKMVGNITLDRLSAWIGPVAVAVANPPPDSEIQAKMVVMADVLSDLPDAVLTVETRRQAIRKWRFWPTPADAYEFLNERAQEIATTRALLQRISVLDPEPPEPDPPLTEAQRKQIQVMSTEYFSRFPSRRPHA